MSQKKKVLTVKTDSHSEEVLRNKMGLYMGLLLCEQSLINLRELTDREVRYEATKQLKYIQNVLRQFNARSRSSKEDIETAEESMLENVALIKHVAETLVLLPPHLVDIFEDKYNAMYNKLIKHEIDKCKIT